MNPLSERDLRLIERLGQHPELRDQFEGLLDEVENRASKLNTADDAEDALVERVREIGREALKHWAQRRHDSVQPKGLEGEGAGVKKTLLADDFRSDRSQ